MRINLVKLAAYFSALVVSPNAGLSQYNFAPALLDFEYSQECTCPLISCSIGIDYLLSGDYDEVMLEFKVDDQKEVGFANEIFESFLEDEMKSCVGRALDQGMSISIARADGRILWKETGEELATAVYTLSPSGAELAVDNLAGPRYERELAVREISLELASRLGTELSFVEASQILRNPYLYLDQEFIIIANLDRVVGASRAKLDSRIFIDSIEPRLYFETNVRIAKVTFSGEFHDDAPVLEHIVSLGCNEIDCDLALEALRRHQ